MTPADLPPERRTIQDAARLPRRSWLYVPGDRPDRFTKALGSGADAVVIDLEDAVHPEAKATARRQVVDLAEDLTPTQAWRVWVRINDPAGPWGADDIAAVRGLPLAGVRLPKASDPAAVRAVAQQTGQLLQLLLESAAGLARAGDLATAHENVIGIGLGEADLAADLRVGRGEGLDWARGQLVVTARAAGLPSPVQSVWTDVGDVEGLRHSSRRGKELGFFGRSVIHPAQIAPVHEAYTPTSDEVDRASAVVEAAEAAGRDGDAALLDPQGRFIDPAVVEQARVVLALTESIPAQEET